MAGVYLFKDDLSSKCFRGVNKSPWRSAVDRQRINALTLLTQI
jgi:hypothetical protein